MKRVAITITIDLIFWFLMFLAYIENVGGAYNVVTFYVVSMFVLSVLALLVGHKEEAAKNYKPKANTVLGAWVAVSTIGESLFFAWFGSFWLAALSIAGLFCISAARYAVKKDYEKFKAEENGES